MGRTAREKAEVEMWQRRVEQTLFDSVAAYFHHATPGLGALETYQNPEWGRRSRDRAVAALERLDARLRERRFVAGDCFSIADITALCAVDFATALGLEIPAGCEALRRWYDEVSARPSAAA